MGPNLGKTAAGIRPGDLAAHCGPPVLISLILGAPQRLPVLVTSPGLLLVALSLSVPLPVPVPVPIPLSVPVPVPRKSWGRNSTRRFPLFGSVIFPVVSTPPRTY